MGKESWIKYHSWSAENVSWVIRKFHQKGGAEFPFHSLDRIMKALFKQYRKTFNPMRVIHGVP
jgi:hypothetical protein